MHISNWVCFVSYCLPSEFYTTSFINVAKYWKDMTEFLPRQ